VYHKARAEIGELLDYQLHQMALAVRNEALERYAVIEPPPSGFDYAIQVSSEDGVQLYYSRSRVRLPAVARGGYDVTETAEGPWRVYTLQSGSARVQVAQPMYVRDRIAARAAWRSMTPFILLLPLLAAFVWVAVTRGLRPLKAVADAVKARSPSVLDPLPQTRVPSEIAPVVLALNDLLTRLSRALETQRAFVADAAHELRTPLTALRLQLQLAERAQDEAQRATALASLRDGLTRATHLIEQLLTLAREEPSAAPRTTAHVDLGEVAAEAVGLRALIAESKGVDLGLARRDSDVTVVGEREALLTLLSNLIDNAVRYTPAGGCVDVCVFRVEGAPVLEVTDTGPGIPPDERERVFDRFYRRATTDVPGSGLGLAIVRSIAERHRASLRLDSGPAERGLRVRVTFPLDANSAA
jgi:two-component system OmpR family sensor kinase